jgi:hypothetical protein
MNNDRAIKEAHSWNWEMLGFDIPISIIRHMRGNAIANAVTKYLMMSNGGL